MAEQTQLLPFHAINEFMRPDFRLNVIRDVLNNLASLPEKQQEKYNHLTREHIKVPGFRNSEKAPAMVKVVPLSKAFEKHADLVSSTLSVWADLHADLRQHVYDLLKGRGWKMLILEDLSSIDSITLEAVKKWAVFPIDFDRTRLPGFHMLWPKGEDFETLYNHFTQLYPSDPASMDQVSLMAVWLSLRLPYQMEEPEAPSDQEVTPPQSPE